MDAILTLATDWNRSHETNLEICFDWQRKCYTGFWKLNKHGSNTTNAPYFQETTWNICNYRCIRCNFAPYFVHVILGLVLLAASVNTKCSNDGSKKVLEWRHNYECGLCAKWISRLIKFVLWMNTFFRHIFKWTVYAQNSTFSGDVSCSRRNIPFAFNQCNSFLTSLITFVICSENQCYSNCIFLLLKMHVFLSDYLQFMRWQHGIQI